MGDMANVCEEVDRRVVGGRNRNRALQRAGEQALEARFAQMEKAQRVQTKRKNDMRLANAMAARDKQVLKQEREVAQICDNDPTLRALKAKIQAAYMNKERVVQAALKAQEKEKLKEEDAKFFKEAAENREGLLAKEKAKEEEMAQMRIRQRDQIQAQLRRNENEARLRKIQEFQAERRHANEIIMKIQKQVQEEDAAARKKMEEINAMMHEGLRLRKIEQERRRRAEAEQEKEIAEHKERVAHRNDKLIALKKQQAAAKEQIRLAIEADAMERQKAEEEMLEALDTLRKEQKEKLEEKKEMEKLRKKYEDKMTMMNANEAQKEESRRRKLEEKERERVIVAKMKDKFRQDDLRAEAKARAHKELELNYKKSIHKQMAVRADFFAAAKAADRMQQQLIQEKERFRERVVEEARKAILREHAAKLKDFLPKGVFAKESDLEMLSVFDTDGDDSLSAGEVAAAKRQLLAYGDADGDGKLDKRERERAFQRLRSAVDTDGDGQLSADERRRARQLNTR